MSGARVERVVTRGLLVREGPGIPIENNVWIVGDDSEAIVIDAAHDAAAIAEAVGDRRVAAVLLTHGHEDHINAAIETARLVDAPLHLHADDRFLWEELHDTPPDAELTEGARFETGGLELVTVHTPGHTPGSVCFVAPELGTVLTGDTLFDGGPGATRWRYSSFPQIISSISSKLFSLPEDTVALPGHGAATTIGAERARLAAWVNRPCGAKP
ncbi:MBL fold metallo-hydrolase [Leucobacter sp. CSA1]|uniref:MBL fold metallo-hydrolase n=1 Tax=Leucobacter chromiisoli TaxID=2796471 RepID=A0A934UTU6_9MICO|nr:MBL fold metallo-hydrolase [Leucobacter chromiisoli]MBK0418115.1 MBL fold metallo-hydrolase [Leucobacter chromiisoli]